MLVEVLCLIPATLVAGYLGIKLCCPWLLLDIRYIMKVVPTLGAFRKLLAKKCFIIEHFESTVKQNPDRTFLLFEDKFFTYKEANILATKVARTFLSLGLKRGDTISLVQYNTPEFMWVLLDTDLISAIGDILCDFPDAVVYVLGSPSNSLPPRFTPLESRINAASSDDIDAAVRSDQVASDPVVYIFTSGTTGLPKAATVPHQRLLSSFVVSSIVGFRSDDTVFVTLPMYHSNALIIGVCSAICHGSTIAVAKKFSRTQFWKDVRRFKVTIFPYIGEMCRYLLANEKTGQDKNHSVRMTIGNGLRQDIFAEFKDRYDIPVITEFYGATEGVAGFVNIFNVTGACGRSSPFLERVVPCGLFQWDVENESLVRDKDGHCIPVELGKPGLLLMEITKEQKFDGYKGQKQQSESKKVRNVRKDGDLYFNTGDMMTKDKYYNIYFNDRIGDTFRWKSENISTTEVSNLLTDVDFIIDACVYGVPIPGHDGKAGMATLLIKPEVTEITDKELYVISLHCQQVLPAYAIPMFLRMKWGELDMTGTIKQSKMKLKEEGFDYWTIGDPLFYYEKSTKTFKNLNKEAFEDITNHTIMF